jgi:hypothetical protein
MRLDSSNTIFDIDIPTEGMTPIPALVATVEPYEVAKAFAIPWEVAVPVVVPSAMDWPVEAPLVRD